MLHCWQSLAGRYAIIRKINPNRAETQNVQMDNRPFMPAGRNAGF
jgi:hypothetical protein